MFTEGSGGSNSGCSSQPIVGYLSADMLTNCQRQMITQMMHKPTYQPPFPVVNMIQVTISTIHILWLPEDIKEGVLSERVTAEYSRSRRDFAHVRAFYWCALHAV